MTTKRIDTFRMILNVIKYRMSYVLISGIFTFAMPVMANDATRDRESGVVMEYSGREGAISNILLGSIITIILQIVGYLISHKLREGEETKKSFRGEMTKVMRELGQNLYSLMACCDLYLKKCASHPTRIPSSDPKRLEIEATLERWARKAQEHSDKVAKLSAEIRYFVWDDRYLISNGFRTLIKFGRWIRIYRYRSDEGRKQLEVADRLRIQLDKAMIEIYKSGNLPSQSICELVAAETKKMWPDDASEDDDVVIAGVDFVVPDHICNRYWQKYGIRNGEMDESMRTKVYAEMINAMDKGVP